MRRVALIVVLVLAAGAAGAATRPRQAGLRGAEVSSAAAATATAKLSTTLSPISPQLTTDAGHAAASPFSLPDDGQCRERCARTYYFCLSTDGASDCPQDWSSCLADCSRGQRPLPLGNE